MSDLRQLGGVDSLFADCCFGADAQHAKIEPCPDTLAPVSADAMLLDIIGHLGAAISQSIPTDDQIIMERVRAAHELAKLLWRAQS